MLQISQSALHNMIHRVDKEKYVMIVTHFARAHLYYKFSSKANVLS